MSRASLAIRLSQLKTFTEPDINLEQYSTPSEAAATILWDAATHGLIKDKTVIDLGCGPGILGIGALLLGAKKVIFVDIDSTALEILRENISATEQEYEIGETEITCEDVTQMNPKIADTAVLNPPFGTQTKHADTDFLSAATSTGASHVYSFHKTITQDHLVKHMSKLNYASIQRFPFSFSLASTMNHHRKAEHLIAVSCWHFAKSPTKDL